MAILKTMGEFGGKIMSQAADLTTSFKKTISANSAIDASVNSKLGGLKSLQKMEGLDKRGKKFKDMSSNYKKAYGKNATDELKQQGAGLADNISKHQSLSDDIAGKGFKDKISAINDSGIYKDKKSMASGLIKDYYTGQGLKTGLVRGGATAAAYGVVANTGRALSGGTMDRNGSGEKDIAGIPFI